MLHKTKKRRRTKAEMERLRESIWDICMEHQPLTVRNLFYRLVVKGLIEKTQKEYNNVAVRLTGLMREADELPWEWIVDSTRWMRKPLTYRSLKHALKQMQATYRRAVWADQPNYVECWCESSSLAGILIGTTRQWDVPLMPCGGFSSKTFLHEAAQAIEARDKPATILYVGDYDPSGNWIGETVRSCFKRYAPDAEITFKRLAVTAEQVAKFALPSKPPKESTHSKTWEGGTVEAEALDHTVITNLIEMEIKSHLDRRLYKQLQVIEQAEKETLCNVLKDVS